MLSAIPRAMIADDRCAEGATSSVLTLMGEGFRWFGRLEALMMVWASLKQEGCCAEHDFVQLLMTS